MVNYVVFLVLIQPIVCVENIPRIFAYPCDVPVASNDWIFCCRAEHLYDSPIFVFRNTPRQIVSSVTPVFDSSNVPIKFVFGLTTDNAIGIWGCGYYGGVSIYNLTEDRVVTRNSGYRFKDEGDNVTLTWSVMSGHVGVLDPLGRYIHQSELVFNGSSVSLTLQNVTGEMNGTYICISDKTRDALTVIVTYSPTAPSITAFKTTFSGSILSAKFNCMTTSPSAAPQFYVPKLNVSWVYSNTTGYTISEVGTTLYINGLNCDDKKSRPIFCSIREEGGKWSTASFKYPHELCILKPPPVVPTPDCITNSQQQQAGIIVGAIFGALCGICVILYAIYYSYKRCNDWDREDFEDCCSDCCDVVVSHLSCCRKCKKDDNSRLVVTLDISRDNEDELERLRNLYNIHDVSPNISVSEQPYSPTNIQQVEEHAIRDPTASSSATETDQTESVREGNQELNTEPEENLIASSPATELNPISSPATELNQTEIFNRDNYKRQELVIELENCLTDLSRLVDRRENPVSFRRSHIVDDVLNVYSDIDVLRFHLHVKLVGKPVQIGVALVVTYSQHFGIQL